MLAFTLLAAPSAVAEPPEIVVSSDGATTLWFAKELGLAADGEIRWELFGLGFAETYKLLAERALAGLSGPEHQVCTVVTSDGFDVRPSESLDDLVRHALGALRTRVVSSREGFASGGFPALLLELEVVDALWLGDELSAGERLLLVYPSAVFEFAEVELCSMNHSFPEAPQVGDGLALFPYYAPRDAERRVLEVAEEMLFFELGSGLAASRRLFDHDEIRELADMEALWDLVRRKRDGDAEARPFDRHSCTPASVLDADWASGLDGAYAHLYTDGTFRAAARRRARALFLYLGGNDMIGLTGVENGVMHDLDGNGVGELTGWPRVDTALLWLDRDSDGELGGGELLAAPIGADAGCAWDLLAALDGAENGGDGDGRLTPADAAWPRLGLWVDLDRDGEPAAGELFSPADLCLVSLPLSGEPGERDDGNGNQLYARGEAVRRDANGKPMLAVLFEAAPVSVE